jgi:hypothetical protein
MAGLFIEERIWQDYREETDPGTGLAIFKILHFNLLIR